MCSMRYLLLQLSFAVKQWKYWKLSTEDYFNAQVILKPWDYKASSEYSALLSH